MTKKDDEEVLGMLLDAPAAKQLLQERIDRNRPMIHRYPPITSHRCVFGGFTFDGKKGETHNISVINQIGFRATDLHATDWVPEMVPVDPDYCGFYLRHFPDDAPLPSPKDFDVVEKRESSALDLLGLGEERKVYPAKFYPPPGSSTRIAAVFIGQQNGNILTPTSAYANGWSPVDMITCQQGLAITFSVTFLRDAHFEAALRGLVLR